MNKVKNPTAHRATAETATHNEFLKKAGVRLQSLAEENTKLHEQLLDKQSEVSEAQRKLAILDVVLDAADRGRLPHRQIRAKHSQWTASGKDAEYYRGVLSMSRDDAFADPVPAGEKTSASRRTAVDEAHDPVHHEGEIGSISGTAVRFHEGLRTFQTNFIG